MPVAYLSLGSNVGDRESLLRRAVERLGPTRVSSIYETAPMELTDQPRFLNLAVEIQTDETPKELLERIAGIEADLGRQREVPKGPRTLDIDILLYDDLVLDTPQLTIPHPAMHERRFVLEPLAEIAPGIVHPVLGRTIRALLKETLDQDATRRD